MKNIKTSYILIGLAVLIIGGFGWGKYLQSSDPNLISRSAIHWHPQLAIYVKGKKQSFPTNVGVSGGSMAPMHTHEPDGSIHIEMGGPVSPDEITLGRFFEIWGKDFNSFGTNVKMTVNGKENTELQNYQMREGDKIELRYE